jgi:hypothetical protein
MLSFFIVFAIAVPLMIWALSPGPVRRRRPSSVPASVDSAYLPPVIGASLPSGSNCDAGSASCDSGGN